MSFRGFVSGLTGPENFGRDKAGMARRIGRPRKAGGRDKYREAQKRVAKTARWIKTGEGEPAAAHLEELRGGLVIVKPGAGGR